MGDEGSVFFCHKAFWYPAVVLSDFQIFLFEPLSDNINGNPGDLNRVGREGMAQQMRFEHNWFAFFRLKDHTVQQEAHTGRDGSSVKVVMAILEQVWCWGKAMCPPIRRRKRNDGKHLGSAEGVILFEHPPGFFNQPQRLFSNEVVARRVGSLSLGNEAKQVADTSRAVPGSWRR